MVTREKESLILPYLLSVVHKPLLLRNAFTTRILPQAPNNGMNNGFLLGYNSMDPDNNDKRIAYEGNWCFSLFWNTFDPFRKHSTFPVLE
jgi:hypothetical protein